MATIRDVARLSGYSVSTVSIVLNDKAEERNIPAATVAKIREAMAELNYHPSGAASMLRSGKEKLVVALFWVLDNRSSFFMRIMQGMNSVMDDLDHPFELVIHPYENGRLKDLEELIRSRRYQGMIFGAMDREDLAFIESLPENLAACTINRRSDRFSCCYTLPEQIGCLVADHAEQCGCKTVAVVGCAAGSVSREARRAAAVEACRERGLTCIQQLSNMATPAGGMAAAKKIAQMEQKPDMVYLDDEMMALGFMTACASMKGMDIQVVSNVLSFPEVCKGIGRTYAAINIPAEKMGEETARIMAELLKGNGTKRIERLCPCSMISLF